MICVIQERCWFWRSHVAARDNFKAWANRKEPKGREASEFS